MNLFKYGFLLCACFRIACYAEWDPRVFSEKTALSFDVLREPKYLELKKNLENALIHGWCSVEKIHLLADLTALTRPKVCVEIGSFTGSSVLPVAGTLKYLHSGKIFAVDAWSNEEATKLLTEDDPNRSWWALVDMQKVRHC